ncbi:MAG: RT0821/Lpp0805 family surface protein [Azospirillaceae bacterium]|nr:RT0821/Lpp0805 family surface protein [Azospirillaceae bacterium]
MKKVILALMASSVLLSACDTTGGKNQTVGMLGGAAAGGLIGSQFGHGGGKLAMTGLGVLLGGLAGSSIGKRMDEADRAAMERNTQMAYTAPVGQPIVWNNPNNDHQVVVTPVRDGTRNDGSYCREFQQTIVVAGEKQQGYGTACRQPDGSWKIVND